MRTNAFSGPSEHRALVLELVEGPSFERTNKGASLSCQIRTHDEYLLS